MRPVEKKLRCSVNRPPCINGRRFPEPGEKNREECESAQPVDDFARWLSWAGISAWMKTAVFGFHRYKSQAGTDPAGIPQPKWENVEQGQIYGRGRLGIRGNLRRVEMMPFGRGVALRRQQVFLTHLDPLMMPRHNKLLLHSRNNPLLPPGPNTSRPNFFRENWSNVPF